MIGLTLYVLWTFSALFVLLNAFLGLLKDSFTRLLSSGERVTLGTLLRSKAAGPLRAMLSGQFLRRDEAAAHSDTSLCTPSLRELR